MTAGSDLEVHWKETINHKGLYEFQFSPSGDTGWVRLKLVPDPDDAAVPVLRSTIVALPNTPTTTGTLRLIQWADSGGVPPSLVAHQYSCADLELTPPGQAFHTITPCRAVDTRSPAGHALDRRLAPDLLRSRASAAFRSPRGLSR